MDSTAKTERDDRAAKIEGCPTCDKPLPPREDNEAFPFCSARCQLADLSRWLDEDYRL